MKTTKKLAGILLALVMLLAMAVPALAETGTSADKGTITINSPVEGQTYTIYKMFDLESFNTDGDKEAFAYKIASDSDWNDFLTTGYGKDIFEKNDQGYVTLKDGVTIDNNSEAAANLAKAALAYAKEKGISGTEKTFNKGDTELQFTDLPLGYYLVDSSLGALCGLTTTKKNATVNEKNEGPAIHKYVQEDSQTAAEGEGWGESNTAEIGQVVEFKTVVTAKKGAQNYVVHDKMTAGWDFDSSTVAVTVNGTDLTAKSTTVDQPYAADKLDGYAYELKTTELEATNSCSFHIEFVQAYLDSLTKDLNDTNKTVDITVTYSATLNEQASSIATDTNDNTTWLTYGENNHTASMTTKTSTYEFDLVKTDSSNKLLDGAEFRLYDAENDGTEIKVVLDNGVYRLAVTDDEKSSAVAIVVTNGKATVKGLDVNTIYYLAETKQPAGYNKLAARVPVEIVDANLKTTMTGDTWVDGNGGIHVTNYTGAELPSTGGIGTTIFYIVGGVLLVGAGVLLVVRKRMSTVKESNK